MQPDVMNWQGVVTMSCMDIIVLGLLILHDEFPLEIL